MYKKFVLFAIVLLFTIVGCKKSFDPGATKTVKVSNEWWVGLYRNGVDSLGMQKLLTYNDVYNKDSIWIDDYGNIDSIKFKVQANLDSLTFKSRVNAKNAYWESVSHKTPPTVAIFDAKIMPKAGKSATGLTTDSIYFKIKFSNHTGIYEVKGTARTGWAEDDY